MTVVWSVTASAAFLLGLVHLSRWTMDRRAWADLTFSVVSFCFVGVAFTELQSMYARTPDQWAFWVRWCHAPLFGAIAGTVLFVRLYFGTGRIWLAASVIVLRVVIVILNFASDSNVNFEHVNSLAHINFLGQSITVVGDAVTGRWQFLATLSTVLLVAFIVDATLAKWRQGGAENRRRAAVIGGGVLLFVAIASVYTQLIIWRVVTLPFLITPSFAVALLAMAYELSRDTLRAARLARELEESRRRLELAAGAADLGLWEWDSHTNRVWATRQAHAIFGFEEGEMDRIEHWFGRIYPEDAARIRPAMQAALEIGREHSAEFRICPPGTGVRWITALGRAEKSGTGPGTLMRGVIRDVTERRLAQNESAELRRELHHVGRVSLLGQLASALAHELSQPLGAILRNTEAAEYVLASAAPDREELKAIIADIHRDDRRAAEVIDRLRALLKRRQMDLQPVGVEALLEDVIALVRSDAASRHVSVECAVEPGLPEVAGDRVHLSQVLLNIIINAMDAVMELEPHCRRVSVSARAAGASCVEIDVADSGAGIAPDNLARVFDPFFTTKAAGMGMGLSVSRTIIEAHDGQLTAASGESGGALFRVTLPVARSAAT